MKQIIMECKYKYVLSANAYFGVFSAMEHIERFKFRQNLMITFNLHTKLTTADIRVRNDSRNYTYTI